MTRMTLAFDLQCELAGLPKPVPEHRFHPVRRWRMDWAFLAPRQLAVEVEGGAYTQGRHTRGKGFEADLEKYAEAMLLGWWVLRVTPRMVNDGTALRYVEQLLKAKVVYGNGGESAV